MSAGTAATFVQSAGWSIVPPRRLTTTHGPEADAEARFSHVWLYCVAPQAACVTTTE